MLKIPIQYTPTVSNIPWLQKACDLKERKGKTRMMSMVHAAGISRRKGRNKESIVMLTQPILLECCRNHFTSHSPKGLL